MANQVQIKSLLSSSNSQSFLVVLVIICIFCSAGALIKSIFFIPHIAYVNTGKLMIGFSEANKMEKDFKVENEQKTRS